MKSIIYSLKKNSFFFLFLVFSSFCFGDIPWNDSVSSLVPYPGTCRIYTFIGPSTSSISYVQRTDVGSLDELALLYKTQPFGIGIIKGGSSISYPFQDSTTNNSASLTYSVGWYVPTGVNLRSLKWFSPRSFSAVNSIYFFAATLYSSGYSGSGIIPVGEDNARFYFNFDYRSAISDILCSTNTVFRQILLGHLNSIQSSVLNIDTGVSALVPSVDRIADMNSLIATNSFDAVSLLRNIDTNFSSAVSSILDVNPRLDSVTNLLELLHNDSVTGNLDVLLGDDTSSWVGYANWACDNFYITEEERDYFIVEFQATDPDSPSRLRSYSIPDSHRRLLAKSNLKGRVVSANKLRGVYQSLHVGEWPPPTLQRNWLDTAIGEIGSRATTSVRHEIMNNAGIMADWREGLRQQLQDWKTSDEHGILNVKNKIDDVDSAIKKNFEFKPDFPSTNTVPYTTFVTNFVVLPVTNSVNDAAGQVSSNVVEQGQSTRDYLAENLFDPTAGGAYVNIRFPIYGEHQKAVHVHDDAIDVFGSGIDELNYNVGAVLGDMNSHWEKWFRLWDDFAPPVQTNIEEILKVLLNWTNTTAQLNHVLFDDYSNYVHSASYEDLFSTLENDYPFCYSNLVKFGLSSSADGGRWWNVLSSSVSYDTAMMSYVFSDMVELDRIARDNLGESSFSFLRRTLSDMPSKTEIEDYVSQATNEYKPSKATSVSSSLSNSLNAVSNSFDSVFNPFRGHFDSPGSSVTFFKIHDGHDGQYVTIPVGDQVDAWRYIRLGVSFGLVAVNLLLFPKYLLMLFTLFIKAYRIGIKFFPDDR